MKRKPTTSQPQRKRSRPQPSPLRLTISAQVGTSFARFVARKLREAHRLLRSPLRELSLAFVGDRRMSLLHEQFMAISGPTDVLSFPLEQDRRGRVTAGEVVVCIPEARRQAKARKMPVVNEVLLYALHGLLHLSGFDDTTPSQYKRMHRTEDDILKRLGVGRVFEPVGGDAAAKRRRRRLAGGGQRGAN